MWPCASSPNAATYRSSTRAFESRVRSVAQAVLANHPAIHLIGPVDYLPFVAAMCRAYLIVTDSGGIQLEAPGLGKPLGDARHHQPGSDQPGRRDWSHGTESLL